LSAPTANIATLAAAAAVAGAGIAVALSAADRAKKRRAQRAHEKLNIKEL